MTAAAPTAVGTTSALEGRPVIMVTGAAAGIGRAAVGRFADEGFDVVVADIDEDGAGVVADDARRRGVDALALELDVASSSSWDRAIAAVEERLGHLDALFNNAGISGSICPMTEYPVEVFDRVQAVNVRGVFLGMQRAVPLLRSGGAIVNNASVSGLGGGSNIMGYTASKHAVVGMTRSAALELAPHGIRVNAVCPAPTSTAMTEQLALVSDPEDPERFAARMAASIPVGRYGTPEEVAEVVYWLCTTPATFVTGVALPVDGGSSAR